MSPRAAWRLESLGFHDVYDYVDGKLDWMAAGLPTEGTNAEHPRAGDLARKDTGGYFWFVGRKDDVISSGGYRIGPGEIEDCLAGHPAVAVAAAIGVPDAVRGEVVKAFVLLREGVRGTPELARELSDHVRRRLAAHEYPRDIEFVDALPVTTTGFSTPKALHRSS